jgi:anti-sigma B factor antagonist
MIFDTSVSEGGFVIEVSGTLFNESGKALVERVRQALAANQREIVLKLDGVTKIDSSGLGQVISAYTIVINAGGSVKFVFNTYVEGVIRDCHFC